MSLAELMLGGDQVDVLEHRDHRQPGDRRPRPLDVGPEVERPAWLWCAARRHSQVAAKLLPAVERHRHEGDQRAEIGPGDPEPRRGQDRAADQSHGLLGDEADADRLVVADALEHAAQDRELEPHARGGNPGGGRPAVLLDPDGGGDRILEGDRGDRQHHGDDDQRPGPATRRCQQILAGPEAPERSLASGGDLERLADHTEDQEVADQRAERAVIVEHAREYERGHERDDVVEDHRDGQARRLGRVRCAQIRESSAQAAQRCSRRGGHEIPEGSEIARCLRRLRRLARCRPAAPRSLLYASASRCRTCAAR